MTSHETAAAAPLIDPAGVPGRAARPSSQAWTGHTPQAPEYRRILLGLFAAGVATFAQLYSPQGLLPAMARGLGVGAADAAMAVSIATLGVALSVLPWSWAADRFGRLRAMRWAIGSAAVLGLAVPFSPGVESMLALRLLEGMALGGLPAIAVAYLHDEVHARHAVAAAAGYISGTTIGGAAGRLIAGPLAGAVGWRWALFAVALVCAAAALVFLRCMPAALGYQARAAGLRTVLDGVLVSLHDRRLIALYGMATLLFGSFVGVYNYLAFRLEGPAFGVDATLASLIFAAYGAGTVSSRLAGRWVPRVGARRVLTIGAAAMVAGGVLTLSGVLAVVVLGLLVFTAGFFAAHATASSWVGRTVRTARAQATALYNVSVYAGSAVLGWLLGVVWEVGGWGWVVAAISAAIGLGWLIGHRGLVERREPVVALGGTGERA